MIPALPTCPLTAAPDLDAALRCFVQTQGFALNRCIDGIRIADPLAARPRGMREFTARDPFGTIRVVGHVDESMADYEGFQPGDGPGDAGDHAAGCAE